jgi:hypothetical protein
MIAVKENTPDMTRAMESGAARDLKVYSDNYDIKFFGKLSAARPKELLGSKPQTCRFCDKSEPIVTFKEKAHTIPRFLGNKRLLSLYECDSCNERFSAFDADLAKMVMGELSVGLVKGYNGVRTLTSKGQNSRIESIGGQQTIKYFVGEPFMSQDAENRSATIRYQTEPYRLLGAYKCLAKIAFSLLPDDQLINFSELKQWLLEKDVDKNKVYQDGYHSCFHSSVPGFRPYQQPGVILLTRKTDIPMPYCVLVIAFGNISLQIFPPCPKKDHGFVGKSMAITKFPLTYDLQPWLINGTIETTVIDLSAADSVRQERQIFIEYGEAEKHPSQPNKEAAA